MAKIVSSLEEMQGLRELLYIEGRTVGFVPTMGALHAGHLSLVRRAKAENAVAVVSIYVNPFQFGPQEDFQRYPRDLAGDTKLVESAGGDLVFAPTDAEMYTPGFQTFVDQFKLGRKLCGKFRPGHFRGVLTVVLNLLHLVRPHRAYFGQKDYQQSVVIRRMVQDLHVPAEIVVLPIVREEDGLALSSRNRYLNARERKDALCLSQALVIGESLLRTGERRASAVVAAMRARIERVPRARIDYVACVHPETLDPLKVVQGTAVLALAVHIGKTRLIDNRIVVVEP